MSGTTTLMPTGNNCSENNAHSKCFGPSSSHSWLKCPYSAVARQNAPHKTSVYAETGSLAHELCEIKVKLYFGQITPEEFEERLNAIQSNPLYTADMLDSSNTYLETIKEISIANYDVIPIAYVEQVVKYDDLCGADGFGTSDCILLGGDTLTVVDYKNGSGVSVSAYRNPQMMLYAYGALHSVVNPMFYDIKKIIMCIVQPNLDSITVDTIETTELMQWIEKEVKPAIARINAGCKDRVAGHWCRDSFCPNFVQCSAWREKFAAVYADYATDYANRPPDELNNDELGDLFTRIAELGAWSDKLKAKVEYEISNHRSVKGWKLVEGRSTRTIVDIDVAYKELSDKTGISNDMLYKTTPITMTDASKLVGKKDFDTICAPWITKKKGKPTLAPESDPRKSIVDSAASDFADVVGSADNK